MTTPLFGTSTVSLEAAQAWARSRGAHQRFIDVAQWFWKHAPAYGIPPEIPYGLASWETNWGKYTGVVPWTHHNWGGIKTKAGWSDTDPKHHQVFDNDEAGAIAVIQHLYRYGGKTSLPTGETLIDPRYGLVTKYTDTVEGLGGAWAPSATYGLNVAGRVADLRDFANNQTWEPPMSDVPIIQMLLPSDASNTPQKAMTPRYITIHETANPKQGADAVMHGRWLLNLAADGADEPSWHYTVDDHQIVQHMPITLAGYHAGDGGNGTGNMQSIGIELCVNSDGDIQKTRDNAAWLVRKLRGETGIPVDRVVQHNHWSGKNCPTLLRQSGWAAFVAAIQDAPEPTPEQPVDKWVIPNGPAKNAGFQHGFRSWLETQARARFPDDLNAGALAITGYPEADEYGAADGCSYQVCQRMTLRWTPNTEPPWDIVPLLRGEPIPPPKGSVS